MIRRHTLIMTLCLALAAAAVLPGVAPSQTQSAPTTYAIQGARIYTLAGPPIDKGTILIRDGKIVAVGADVTVPPGAEVMDASGLEVYPGFFDSVGHLGLNEVSAVSATVDTTEIGEYNPQLVALFAVHPASELIPVARANGVTHAVSAPGPGGLDGGGGGGTITGQATAIHLAGWTVEEMLIKRSVGMIVHWPVIQTRTFDFTTFTDKERPFGEVKKEQDKKVADLGDLFDRARHYQQAVEKGSSQPFERDLKLEALIPVLRGELPVVILADRPREIKNAIEFCEKHKLRMILGGASQSYKVKDQLKLKMIPVILGPTLALPDNEDDPYDRSFTLPAELHAAGIQFAIASFDSSFSRRLPYQAGNAVAYGLPHDEGLKAITLYPAQIFGLDKQLGTIETGKIANLIVTTGDPLEIRSEVRFLFNNGRPTSTDNKHKQLYEKYRRRP